LDELLIISIVIFCIIFTFYYHRIYFITNFLLSNIAFLLNDIKVEMNRENLLKIHRILHTYFWIRNTEKIKKLLVEKLN
jgi:hypothetical protein